MATLVQATTTACHMWPYVSRIVYTMPKIECTDVPFMAVDQHWRLYYNPDGLQTLKPREAAGVVLHECLHLLYMHHNRYKAIFGDDPANHKIWNIATDLAINSNLRYEGVELPSGEVSALYPEMFGLDDRLTAEKYLSLLMDQAVTVEVPWSGSGSDGIPRDWEQGGRKGVQPEVQDQIVQQVADEVRSQNQGNTAGSLSGLIDGEHVVPRSIVARALKFVRGTIESTSRGFERRSYRRPSRRSRPELLLPSYYNLSPDITIILDTSGSMTNYDRRLGLGVINTVLSTLNCRSGVKVLLGDTVPHKIQRVHKRLTSMEDFGYGGTDMAALIEHAAQDRPDLIMVITDGYTGWPATDCGIPTVACLTQKQTGGIPSWIRMLSLSGL